MRRDAAAKRNVRIPLFLSIYVNIRWYVFVFKVLTLSFITLLKILRHKKIYNNLTFRKYNIDLNSNLN